MSEQLHAELPFEIIAVNPDLTLRQIQPEEAVEVFDTIENNRTYLREWLPWVDATKSVDDSKDFINSTIKNRENGAEYSYGLIFHGQYVGQMSLMHLNDGKEPEIGYWIAQEVSGKGITTTAAEAVTAMGFNNLGLEKIIIRAAQGNIGSNKVAQKLGYTIERTELDEYTKQTANVWIKYNPAK